MKECSRLGELFL